jgi:hypothetical protein
MAATSYKIRNIAPPDLRNYPEEIRRMWWGWVVEFGLKVKDAELARGLDKDGEDLKRIRPRTRKYRRSAMTPSGKGDPNAPPLMPARALSRTRSLLAGRALSTHAEFYWRFDAFTGESWGKVLAIHARKGRDVIGISPKGLARVKALAWERWAAWKAGRYIPAPPKPPSVPVVPRVGTYDVKNATFGIGGTGPGGAQSTGGMTWPEWRKYFTSPNPTKVAIPGRPEGRYNRLLSHVWGQTGRPSPPGSPAQPPGGRPPSKPGKAGPPGGPAPFVLTTRGGVSKSDEAAVRGAIGQLPRPVLLALRKGGIKFALAQKFSDWDPALSTQQPPGWSPGSTWENTDGGYFWNRRIVLICKTRQDQATGVFVPAGRMVRLIRHEVGHGFDDAIGGSIHGDFQAAYNADKARLPASRQSDLTYYLQPGKNGPREVFAEAFAQLQGGGTSPHPIARLFPHCTALVRTWSQKGKIP